MDYCLVVSVGYAVVTLLLWETLALLWTLVYPQEYVFLLYGLPAASLAFFLGALVNCTFQALGALLSLDPKTSILIGWTLLALAAFVAGTLSSPPATLEGFVKVMWGAGQAMANTFPASKIFYDIGNLTLAMVGVK